jgi:nucleoside-diphosphate-sugar epimerase
VNENPLADDLSDVLRRVDRTWEDLRRERLFVTGGTGFIGRWLLESFAWANRELGLNARAVVLTRNAERFRSKAPHLAEDPAISFVPGDVRRPWEVPAASGFRFMIHAAADADASVNEGSPHVMIETIVDGTRHALEFAAKHGTERFLHTSSGAVYGRQPPELSNVPEEFTGGPDLSNPRSAYAEGKRLAELLCVLAERRSGIKTISARCFAFLGPHLPLDRHYAAGNFLRDAFAGGPIRIQGDGTPLRSYLYPSDLAVWLWSLLFRGESGRSYNVGSEEEISIENLAREIARHFEPLPKIEVARTPVPGQAPARYVPSTARARSELGLSQEVSLADAIAKTIAWHGRAVSPLSRWERQPSERTR